MKGLSWDLPKESTTLVEITGLEGKTIGEGRSCYDPSVYVTCEQGAHNFHPIRTQPPSWDQSNDGPIQYGTDQYWTDSGPGTRRARTDDDLTDSRPY